MQEEQPNSNGAAAVVSLNRWLAQVGVTPITAWRWRKRGWLKTVNIAGRQYLTQVAIDEFRRRAVAGDFAQVYKVPAPGGRGVSTRIYTLRGNPQRNVSQGGGV